METEYRRKIDPMSRVTIPNEVRKALDIQCGDEVSVSISDGVILIQKVNQCSRCGGTSKLVGIEEGNATNYLCAGCIALLNLTAAIHWPNTDDD